MRYPAIITKEDGRTLALFTFANGEECATFCEADEDIAPVAAEALEGRLAAYFEDRDIPPAPPKSPPHGKVLWVDVPSRLAAKIAIRWAREEKGMTQTQLGELVGVRQQQIAKVENPDTDPGLDVLDKVARALGLRLELAMVPPNRQEAANQLWQYLRKHKLERTPSARAKKQPRAGLKAHV